MDGDEAPAPVWMDRGSESIRVWLRLPEGYKFLPDGTHQVTVSSSDDGVVHVPPFALPDLTFDYRVPVEVRDEGKATIRVQAMVFFCPVADESICLFDACDVEQPVVVLEGQEGYVEIVHDIEPMG
jgi:hypothetical protein